MTGYLYSRVGAELCKTAVSSVPAFSASLPSVCCRSTGLVGSNYMQLSSQRAWTTFFFFLDCVRTIGCRSELTSLDLLLNLSLCFSPARRSHGVHLAWCCPRRSSRQSGSLGADPAPTRSARHRRHHRPPSATRSPTGVLPRPGPQLAAGRATVPTYRLDQSPGLGGADRRRHPLECSRRQTQRRSPGPCPRRLLRAPPFRLRQHHGPGTATH